MQKCCSNLAVVDVLQRPLSQPYTSHRAHCVSHAAIDLHPNDRLPAIRTARIIEANETTTQQRHPRAQQLPGAHVSVQLLTLFQELFKRLHERRLSQPKT